MESSLRPRRSIVLSVRPLEIFYDAVRNAPYLFKVAPSMTHHWALKIGHEKTWVLFEIGIEQKQIFALPGRPWEDVLCETDLPWHERLIGYTFLSDEQIFSEAGEVIKIMGPTYKLFSANCQKFSNLLFESIRTPLGVTDLPVGLQRVPKPMETFLRRCEEIGFGGGSILIGEATAFAILLSLPQVVDWFITLQTAGLGLLVGVLVTGCIISYSVTILHAVLSVSIFRALSQLSRGKSVKDWAFITSAIVTASGFSTFFGLFSRIVNLETDIIAIESYRGFLICFGFLLLSGGYCFIIGYMMLSFYPKAEFLDQNVVFGWFGTLSFCLLVWLYNAGGFTWELSVHPLYAHRGPFTRQEVIIVGVAVIVLMLIGSFLVFGVWVCFSNTGREVFRVLVADFNSIETSEPHGNSKSDLRGASQSGRRAKQD